MREIIVAGVVHHNTLGMIRCLGHAGYQVELIIMGCNGYISKSKYVKHTTLLKDVSELICVLQKKFYNENKKQIVIACTDTIASILDQNYSKLKDSFEFFNCGLDGKVTYYMNKQVQVELANTVGIATPYSYEYMGVLEGTVYPCLLKPVQSINGGKKVVICNNEKELITHLSSCSKENIIMIQQFIKKDCEIVVLGCSTINGIIIPGYILKHRDFDGGTLFATVCTIEELPTDLVEKCKNIINSMRYVGLFGIEFIKSGNLYYFIEVNLRNDATTYALAVAGVNLPDIYIKSLIGEKQLVISDIRSINSIVEFNDFKHRKQFNLRTRDWLKQYLNSKCKYYWNCFDPLPFIFAPFK